jgi:hypothetical protein
MMVAMRLRWLGRTAVRGPRPPSSRSPRGRVAGAQIGRTARGSIGFGWALIASTLAACADVDFGSDGAGGAPTSGATSANVSTSATTTGDAASSTTGAGGSEACANKRCGDDGQGGLCNGRPMLPSWTVTLNDRPLAMLADPATQSVYVATDGDRIVRLDECDGAVIEQQSAVSNGEFSHLFGLERAGDALLVLGEVYGPADGFEGFRTPLALTGPSARLFLDGSIDTNHAAVATRDDGSLVLAMERGRYGRVDATGTACESGAPNGFADFRPRGVAHLGDQVLTSFLDPTTSNTALRFDAGACTSSCAACAVDDAFVAGGGTLYNALVASSGRFVAVGMEEGVPAFWQVDLEPFEPGVPKLVPIQSNSNAVLLAASAHGARIVAGGATGLIAAATYDDSPKGVGLVIELDDALLGDAATFEFAGAENVSAIEAFDVGTYVAGRAENASGFLAKCAPGLACAPIP